ncbi:hypothetical protein [Marinobacterium aestuariivivens]|uniref:Uncharacterized protein n=1 Tax=Marinobacterium aestuariivivens TaxID=1698799 RepID=A0ABW2A716_9GAMM
MNRTLLSLALGTAVAAALGCRPTFDEPVTDTTGEDGGPGNDYSVQCSGWFPDWIARAAPPAGSSTFQLAQGYPLGVPQFNDEGELTGWNPRAPSAVRPGSVSISRNRPSACSTSRR